MAAFDEESALALKKLEKDGGDSLKDLAHVGKFTFPQSGNDIVHIVSYPVIPVTPYLLSARQFETFTGLLLGRGFLPHPS